MDFIAYLHTHQIVLLFLIISIGYLVGQIKIFGFSLGSSAIIFVAMFFGHHGFKLSHDFQILGLILFIYAIGLNAGPVIFNMSKKQSMTLYTLILVLLSSGAVLTYLASKLWQLDMNLAVGLFAGSMTSTPGLAAAQEAANSPLTSTGYALAYPVGVVGVVLFIKLLPVVLGVNLKKENQLSEEKENMAKEEIVRKTVLVTNESLEGKTLAELNFAKTTGAIVSRIMRDDQLLVPGADVALQLNDLLCIVGEKSKIRSAIPFIGKASAKKISEVHYFGSKNFVVTNKEIVGKSLAELNLHAYYNVNITRIRRGGMEFTAEPRQRLQWGDRLRVAGEVSRMDAVQKLLGDEMKKLEAGNIYSIIIGILFGVAFGLIPFSIGGISLKLGVTGGVLLAGLFLSNRGKVGPVIWLVPAPIKNFMRELGLTLFLAVVGINAGPKILHTITGQGPQLLLIGVIIVLIPMLITTILARSKYKMLLIELFGLLSGGMTSTPGLAAGTTMTDSQRPLVLYATVYPFAMILMMVLIKILMVLP